MKRGRRLQKRLESVEIHEYLDIIRQYKKVLHGTSNTTFHRQGLQIILTKCIIDWTKCHIGLEFVKVQIVEVVEIAK